MNLCEQQCHHVTFTHLENFDFVGLLVKFQYFDGNLITTQLSLPDIAVATAIQCRFPNKFYSFKGHAFWIQAGSTRQLYNCAGIKMLERLIQWEAKALF